MSICTVARKCHVYATSEISYRCIYSANLSEAALNSVSIEAAYADVVEKDGVWSAQNRCTRGIETASVRRFDSALPLTSAPSSRRRCTIESVAPHCLFFAPPHSVSLRPFYLHHRSTPRFFSRRGSSQLPDTRKSFFVAFDFRRYHKAP